MTHPCGIYVIRNTRNGRIYVGSSINLVRRQVQHFSCLRHSRHRNAFLQADFNKCGEKAFIFEVLCYCDSVNVLRFEQTALNSVFDKGKLCYNISPTVGTTLGVKLGPHSEDHKRKIALAMLGHKVSTETRNKMASAKRGKPRPEEIREILRQGRIGRWKKSVNNMEK